MCFSLIMDRWHHVAKYRYWSTLVWVMAESNDDLLSVYRIKSLSNLTQRLLLIRRKGTTWSNLYLVRLICCIYIVTSPKPFSIFYPTPSEKILAYERMIYVTPFLAGWYLSVVIWKIKVMPWRINPLWPNDAIWHQSTKLPLVPSHHLKQRYIIVNWIPRNKLQWNFNQYNQSFYQKMYLKYRLRSVGYFTQAWMC